MKSIASLLSLLSFSGLALAGPGVAPVTSGAVTDAGSSSSGALRPCLCHNAFTGVDKPFAVNINLAYDSSYLCRGMDIGENLFAGTLTIDAAIAPNLKWTLSGRYMELESTDFSEINVYTGLFYTVGKLTIGPSFRYYQFRPNGGEMNAYDIGLQALYKAGPLDITAGYYYETESEGSYAELGVAAPIKLTNNISLVPSAEISYTDGWLNPALSGFNVVSLRLAVPIKASENVMVVPYIGGQFPLEALDSVQEDKLFGGVSLSFTF